MLNNIPEREYGHGQGHGHDQMNPRFSFNKQCTFLMSKLILITIYN